VCGISGHTHRGGVFNPSAIKESTDRLLCRGPDQQGTYESDDVSLGAVRLKIIDLVSGAQPFSTTTERPFWSSTVKSTIARKRANRPDCFAPTRSWGRSMAIWDAAPTLAFTSWE
jgi:hypothetical protein